MLTRYLLPLAACAAIAHPAAAEYASAPFHERPLEVARLALQVFDGETVSVPAEDPALAAAVAAMLLISEQGLAEAYEAALGGDEADDDEDADGAVAQGDPYGDAFAALQTVRPWIAAVPGDAPTQAEIDDLLARLDALLPSPERPPSLDADPEAAEILAQALVGVLEGAADADLYLGRDLRRAIDTVAGLADDACRAPNTAARLERLRIAAFYHEESLEAPFSVLAAGAAEEIEELFAALLAADGDPEAACAGLGAAYAEARQTLFPQVSQ